ncbi:MAG TPA: hypothetical protein VEX66_11520, partial [Microlunatus sp.]|nr:hypothetical protein [Microlunatus sp.]
VSGCNPDPGPTPSGSPTAAPSVSPSAKPSPTPTENAQEREQREAFEAAEKAYRTGFAEVGQLSTRGGVSDPTRTMRQTMTGEYLTFQMSQLELFKKQGLRATAVGQIGWLRASGYSAESLHLETCEDFRKVHLVNDAGATESPGEDPGTRVYRQSITMKKSAGRWKAATLKTVDQLRDCDS